MFLKYSCKNNIDIVQIFLCAENRITSYGSKIQLSKQWIVINFFYKKQQKKIVTKNGSNVFEFLNISTP